MAASVHQRLLNMARSSERPFNELLQYYGMERFLYRLSLSPHAQKLILKGALMLVAWRTERTRPTMDIDFLGRMENDPETVKELAVDVCQQAVPEDDGIMFDTANITAERITEDAEYMGVRVRFSGMLGRAKFPMQLDIGFGDMVTPEPVLVEYPPVLHGPGPVLQGYNRESTIAEKFEAMIKLSELNSRMKDFFDIWYLSRTFRFDGQALLEACASTFKRRESEITADPNVLQPEFGQDDSRQKQWAAFRRKSRLDYAPESFSELHDNVTAFLNPIAESMAAEKPYQARWSPYGPWKRRLTRTATRTADDGKASRMGSSKRLLDDQGISL